MPQLTHGLSAPKSTSPNRSTVEKRAYPRGGEAAVAGNKGGDGEGDGDEEEEAGGGWLRRRRREKEEREVATAEEEEVEACNEGWRQRLRQRLQKKKRWGRRGQRRSSATETLLGRRRWPQRQRSRRRKQGWEVPVKKMAMAAFLGDGRGRRWERWWARAWEVEGCLAFDGSGGSRETEKRGRAGEGSHGDRGGGLDDERRGREGRSEGEEGGAVEEAAASGVEAWGLSEGGDEKRKKKAGEWGGAGRGKREGARGCVPCVVARARGRVRPHLSFFFF